MGRLNTTESAQSARIKLNTCTDWGGVLAVVYYVYITILIIILYMNRYLIVA